MDYLKLSEKVISLFFENNDFDLIAKISWEPVSDRQKERHLKKTGKELTQQRVKYSVDEKLKAKPLSKEKNESPFFNFRNFYISEIERDDIFYCIIDYSWNRMGQKNRYKFKISKSSKKSPILNIEIDILDQVQLMIR